MHSTSYATTDLRKPLITMKMFVGILGSGCLYDYDVIVVISVLVLHSSPGGNFSISIGI